MTKGEIEQKINGIFGVDVFVVNAEYAELSKGDAFCDEKNDRTVFIVPCDGENVAFAINGVGEDKLVIARLLKEIATAPASAHDGVNALREFLCGNGQEPAVRVGKSDYYVFAIYCKTRSKSVFDYLSAMACGDDFVADMSGGITAFCKKSDGDDYQSAGEFAVVLRENFAEEIDENVKIGVGGVAHGLSELPVYYGYARSALLSGAEFDPKSDVYSYKEYALIRALSELSPIAMEKYVKTVLEKNYKTVLADEELMTAADAFIQHSLNISEASRSMYVHRNTLIYRLDKIEKMTGLNIRNFNDAMSFRVAYLIYKSMR